MNAYYNSKTKTTQKTSSKQSEKQTKNDVDTAAVVDEEADHKPKNRNRNALLYDDEDEKPIEKFDKKIDREKEKQQQKKITSDKKDTMNKSFKDFLGNDDSVDKPTSSTKIESKNVKRKSPTKKSPKEDKSNRFTPVASKAPKRPSSPRDTNLSKSQSNQNDTESIKRPKIDKKPEKMKVYRPFNKLLSDVVFAISGIQNPLRAELRQKALELGAKYKPDWDNSCTHLM